MNIRSATEADAPAVLEIYRPFVENTAVSFEMVAPTVDELAARVRKAQTNWEWLVAERDGQILGYAYGSMHRERPGYRWSVEVSAYVDPRHHRQGVGRALYLRLFEILTDKGFCNAYAGITQPNEASVALHRSLGFEPVGIFKSIGRKYGKWQDVAWFHRVLRDSPPSEPEAR